MSIELEHSKVRLILSNISRFLAHTSELTPDMIQIAISARLVLSNLEPEGSTLEKNLERSIFRLYFAVKYQSQYVRLHQETVIIDCREVLKQWSCSLLTGRAVAE